ncbi:MAG: hypothetical protein QM820_00805 [Minicystis sp.]
MVRADDAHGLWILEDATGHRLAFNRTHPQYPIKLYPSRLAGALRPHDAFTALAALGLAVALAALLGPRRSLLPADASRCRDAVVTADGTLRLTDDATPIPPPPGAAIHGPVVAVLATQAGSFRDHAGPAVERVVPGSLAQHRLAERLGPHAFALAFVVIASTPLLVALLCLR